MFSTVILSWFFSFSLSDFLRLIKFSLFSFLPLFWTEIETERHRCVDTDTEI